MALQTIRSGATELPEEMFDFFMSHVLDQGGVKSIDSTGDLYVSEKSGGTNMSVDVHLGFAFVRNSAGTRVYPVRLYSAVENVAITANSSGNTRKDAIVLYIDLSAESDATATNVAKLVAVPGTPAPASVAPTDGEISTSIGASNPFIRLANVTVSSGASEIVNANISDTRIRAINIKKTPAYTVVTDAGTITFDAEKGALQTTLGGNRTLAVENYQSGDEFSIKIIQPSGGNKSVTWWSGIDWDANVTPMLTLGGNLADVFLFKVKSDKRFEGYIVGQGMPIA